MPQELLRDVLRTDDVAGRSSVLDTGLLGRFPSTTLRAIDRHESAPLMIALPMNIAVRSAVTHRFTRNPITTTMTAFPMLL